MTYRLILFPLALVALVGCEPALRDDEVAIPVPVCDAQSYQQYLWQPESFLANLNLPTSTRVIRPNMAVTLDYRADRLNIVVGDLGRVERIYCG